jgi:hypothetical protein
MTMLSSSDVYQVAEDLVLQTGFQADKETLIISVLQALGAKDVEALKNVIQHLSPEDQEIMSEAIFSAVTSARRKIENDIVASGNPDEVAALAETMASEQREVKKLMDKMIPKKD